MHEFFDVADTPLRDVKVLERKPLRDDRGYFERLFCAENLRKLLGYRQIVQINRTFTSKKGAVRGMHFQYPPSAETKIVCCLRGKVFDVAVDIRRGSATFLRWHAKILSDQNHHAIVIPEGCAHGFQTLTSDCEMLYFHTAAYNPDAEGGLDALDPALSIEWPIDISERSVRDTAHPVLTNEFSGLVV